MGSKDVRQLRQPDPDRPLCVEMVIQQFHPIVGGAERQAQRLGAALVREGTPVTLTTVQWDAAWPSAETVDGIRVRRLRVLRAGNGSGRAGAGISFMIHVWWDLMRRARSFDVLHIHQALKPAVAAVAAGVMTGTPTIIKVGCGGDWNDITLMRRLRLGPLPVGEWMVRILLRATRIVALNPSIARDLIAEGFRTDQVIEIPNGVVALPPKRYRRGATKEVQLLFVGRLDHQKGLDVLLEALARVPNRLRWSLTVVGTGGDDAELRQKAATLGVAGSVRFVGQVNDVPERLRRSDVFVLPSRAEGMSNALLEAMSVGIACVATAIGGNSELVRDGVTGVLVPAGDAQALGHALERLMRSPALRRKLGEAAREIILRSYTIDAVAGRYRNEYRAMLHRTNEQHRSRSL